MLQLKELHRISFDERSSTLNYGGSCPTCSFVIPPLRESAPVFFEQDFWTCRKCGVQVDLWAVNLGISRKLAGMSLGLMSLGAAQTNLTVHVEDGKAHTIDFAEHGVPRDATILSVTYSPTGEPVFPIEWHGNSPARRRYAGTSVTIVGHAAVGAGASSDVAIIVCWVQKEESTGWQYLIDAFEAISEKRYTEAIPWAQSAVEISLMPMISDLLKQSASADNVRSLMADTGFGHALNVILPFICKQFGIPQLPDAIRGSLNRLRRFRNDIVHEGKKPDDISKEEAAECLCAAVFGFEYMRWIRGRLPLTQIA